MAYSTDMVERPRKLDDTIADLMGGQLTVAVVKHAVAELKRLRDIRVHMEHLRTERAVSEAEVSAARAQMPEMIKSYLAQEIANRVIKAAKITDVPGPFEMRVFRAEAMMLPMALYEAVVPPAPQLNGYERNAKPLG